MTVQHTSIIFLTPPQPNLEVIRNNIGDFYIKLVAKRKSDGHTSRGFNFQYSEHIQCDHTVDGKDAARIEPKARAKPKCRKRNMGPKKPNTTTPPEKISRRDEIFDLLESSEGGSPKGVFEMPSPSHSCNSTYKMSVSPVSSPLDSFQTVSLSQEEIDNIHIPSDLHDALWYSGLNHTSVSEDEVRNVLGWTREKVEEEEEEDHWSNSSGGMVQDDDDIFNTINKEDLLNISSPEYVGVGVTSKPIPNVLLKSQDPMMSGGIKTPVFFQPRLQGTIFTDSSQKEKTVEKDVHDDDQKVNLRKRKNESQEVSPCVYGRSPLLEDLPMLFVVLFMITFCMVHLSCGVFGFQMDNLLLMTVSTVLSVGGILIHWMKSVRQGMEQCWSCDKSI